MAVLRHSILGALLLVAVTSCGLSLTGASDVAPDGADASSVPGPGGAGGSGAADGASVTPAVNDAAAMDGALSADAAFSDAATTDAADGGTIASVAPATYLCGGNSVASCSSCGGSGVVIGCIYCSAGGVVGGCLADGRNSSCKDQIPNAASTCPCTTAGDCPNDRQVCLSGGGGCTICGEELSNGLKCRNGKTCNKSMDACL